MGSDQGSSTKLRYRWSHRHPVHQAVVRAANHVLPSVPYKIKYGLTDAIRSRNLPYRLLQPDSIAVQVGAPSDTLLAGRSRAMTFARRTAPNGRVLVVEPDGASAEEFRRVAELHELKHVLVVSVGAWHERTTLRMRINSDHPATNFTEGSANYTSEELTRFQEISVEAMPVDDLVEQADFTRVDLISITTNGAEEQILRGLHRTIERDHPCVSLARTGNSHTRLMRDLGYEIAGADDRGFTFCRKD